MRVCIDLDGVIAKIEREKSYGDRTPVEEAAKSIRILKERGHYIIIHTARRMKTHKGNVGAVIADTGRETLNWLHENGIHYHEVIFGKPFADVYIDDNAIRFYSWNETMGKINELNNHPGW